MTLRLGQSVLRGSIQHFAKYFDLYELSAEPGRLPNRGVLRKWRDAVPEGFVFSVALPGISTSLAAGAAELDRALEAAALLDARWLVLRTPRTVTPTSRNRDRLRMLVEQLKPNGRELAWQAEGLWEDAEAREFARVLDVCWVVDPSRDDLPDREPVYARLRALGSGGGVGAGAVERAAERLAACRDASVVIDGRAAGGVGTRLRALTLELRGEIEGPLDDSVGKGEVGSSL